MAAQLAEPLLPRNRAGDGVTLPSVPEVLALMRDISGHASHSGVLRYASGAKCLGEVFLSQGRLCLVSRTRGHVRLGDLLAERFPEARHNLGLAIARARSTGTLLGEALLDLGTPVAQVRECLLEQIGRGITALASCQQAGPSVESIPLPGSYDELLTFDPLEVYAHAAAALAPSEEGDTATLLFDEFASEADVAVVFESRWQGKFVPVAYRARHALSLEELCTLAGLAQHNAQPAALLAAGVAPQVISAGRGKSGCLFIKSGQRCTMLGGINTMVRGRVIARVIETGFWGKPRVSVSPDPTLTQGETRDS